MLNGLPGPRSIVLTDNARYHEAVKAAATEGFQRGGVQYLHLPRYSPDWNRRKLGGTLQVLEEWVDLLPDLEPPLPAARARTIREARKTMVAELNATHFGQEMPLGTPT
jgi:hypothetical protein